MRLEQKNTRKLILQDDEPIHVGVKRVLKSRIGSVWKVGDRLPPISELARQMKVGQNGAHRAVRELVADGVLFSRRRLGVFVRAMPQEDAPRPVRPNPGLLSGKTVALVFQGESPQPFVQRMIDGFREVAEEAGAVAVVQSVDVRTTTVADTPGAWATVLFNPNSDIGSPPGKRNLTIVSTADHLHPDLLSRFDSVGIDQYQGGVLAGRTLRDAGCRHVCFLGHRVAINTHRYDLTSSARLCGFERGWGQILPDSSLLYAPGYSVHAGGRRVREYLKMSPRPDGVFVASDELALGFIAATASHGLRPGRDFHLIGFDGQDRPDPDGDGVQITTVRVPGAEMGRRAAEMMIARAANPSLPPQRLLLTCAMWHGNTVNRQSGTRGDST